MDIKKFLEQKNVAVVGSFRNEEKVAYKIVKQLISKGRNVFPVNPNIDEVAGIKCYKTILDLPEGIGFVNFVTPPEVSKKLLNDCKKKGIMMAWFQPGASNEEVIKYAESLGIETVHSVCLMVNV
jgi:predicted CoA-binding protein